MFGVHPYKIELYYDDIITKQGDVFYSIREDLPRVDEKWFIETYMRSDMRRLLDQANPKYAAMSAPELVYWFINFEQDGRWKDYKLGDPWWGFLPQWAGHIYSYYQWMYNVASADLIDVLTLADMERIFPALHQMSWETAAQKIHDEVLSGRG